MGKRKRMVLRSAAAGLLLCLLPVGANAAQQTEAVQWDTAGIRAYADADALCIGRLKQGTALTVLGQTRDYYEIDLYGMTGYIAKRAVNGIEHKYYVNQSERTEVKTLVCRDTQALQQAREQVVALAQEQLGVPYVWGGTTPAGFDCSGFVQYVYAQMDIDITRTATDQLAEGIAVDKEELEPGDLVFFDNTTAEPGIVSHVGIYIGERQLIHAGPNGISIADIDGAYYAPRFVCARRLLVADDPLPARRDGSVPEAPPLNALFMVQALEK